MRGLLQHSAWRAGLWICAAALLQSCGTDGSPPAPKPPAPVAAAKPAPAVKPVETAQKADAKKSDDGSVAFADTSNFDSQLSRSLDKAAPFIKISSEKPMSPNAIPPRLEKWFSAVVKSGGTVKLQKVPPPPPPGTVATRGFLFEIVDLVFTIYDIVHEMVLYAPAEKYNVVVVYNGTVIQDIKFNKRDATPVSQN